MHSASATDTRPRRSDFHTEAEGDPHSRRSRLPRSGFRVSLCLPGEQRESLGCQDCKCCSTGGFLKPGNESVSLPQLVSPVLLTHSADREGESSDVHSASVSTDSNPRFVLTYQLGKSGYICVFICWHTGSHCADETGALCLPVYVLHSGGRPPASILAVNQLNQRSPLASECCSGGKRNSHSFPLRSFPAEKNTAVMFLESRTCQQREWTSPVWKKLAQYEGWKAFTGDPILPAVCCMSLTDVGPCLSGLWLMVSQRWC